jgi:hypothetical protein
MIVRQSVLRYTSKMTARNERWIDKKAGKKEIGLLLVGAYGAIVALGNLALALAPYSHIRETREYSREDGLSQDISAVASAMAGYDVDVACTHDVSTGKERDGDGNRTMGEVTRYDIVLPPVTLELPYSPNAMRLHASLCKSIVGQKDYLNPHEARQDAAKAYSYILHELVHMDYPSLDETMTQCKTIEIMPEKLESIGIEPNMAQWATQYADQLATKIQSPEYHEYPCPK